MFFMKSYAVGFFFHKLLRLWRIVVTSLCMHFKKWGHGCTAWNANWQTKAGEKAVVVYVCWLFGLRNDSKALSPCAGGMIVRAYLGNLNYFHVKELDKGYLHCSFLATTKPSASFMSWLASHWQHRYANLWVVSTTPFSEFTIAQFESCVRQNYYLQTAPKKLARNFYDSFIENWLFLNFMVFPEKYF